MNSASDTNKSASRSWVPPTAEALHALLPEYEIVKLIGRGGMGAVYMGRQFALDRTVAIKILSNEYEGMDASYAERFKNEARAMAKLTHPGIVAVHDFGEKTGGLLYIVMEYVDGTDVARMIAKDGRLHSEHAMAITAHVCDALAYAHRRGIIHRDIKPGNIMVGFDGVVKIADFGLAKISAGEKQHSLTQSGMTMGTPHFMAPEALTLGSSVDHRADIYAVGVMLHQMLTGKIPQGMFRVASSQVVGLDPRYDRIITKAVMEEREARYQSAEEMRRDLDAIVTQPVEKLEETVKAASAALPLQARPQRPGSALIPTFSPSSENSVQAVPKGTVVLHEALVLWGGVLLFGLMLFGGVSWLTRTKEEPEIRTPLVQTPPTAQVAPQSTSTALTTPPFTAADAKTAGMAVSETATVPSQSPAVAVPPHALGTETPKANPFRTPPATDTMSSQAKVQPNSPMPAASVPSTASGEFASGKVGDTRGVDLGKGVKLTLCYIPPGEFEMGSPLTEKSRGMYETQVHVRISRGFWLAKTECSQAQWRAVMGSEPSLFKGDNLPVEQVSWDDAQAFMNKLNGKGDVPKGWKWRLPTEAQWEYSCRAGTTTTFSVGDTLMSSQANISAKLRLVSDSGEPRVQATRQVGSYAANAWGLHDMHGNVNEWCQDWHYSKLSGGVDPEGASRGDQRVCRGGSWTLGSDYCRSARRSYFGPDTRRSILGFRVALVPDQTTALNALQPAPSITTTPSSVSSFDNGKIGDTRIVVLENNVGLTLCYVPPGSFMMGSPVKEIGRGSEGENQVQVKISRSFWMAKTECTQAQWHAVMRTYPSRFKGGTLPVEGITWEEARRFVTMLNTKRFLPTGWKWGLPSEAQWEHACRAGTTVPYAGDLEQMAWYYPNSGSRTQPVGGKAANAWGLQDMHGNVYEWCGDWYARDLTGGVNPTGPSFGSERVNRGGSWFDVGHHCRSAYRGKEEPDFRDGCLGVRVVVTPD